MERNAIDDVNKPGATVHLKCEGNMFTVHIYNL